MTQFDIEAFVTDLDNIRRIENMGYVFFFVGEEEYLPAVTIAYADTPGDEMSNLNREGVFRVNIGVKLETFKTLFPEYSSTKQYDYTELDIFMPHPHYAAYGYICILNPSEKHQEEVKQYILEAYEIAKKRESAKK